MFLYLTLIQNFYLQKDHILGVVQADPKQMAGV